ncbi:MAG TPA: hypothetical protein VMX74_13335 [Pirellulales bacterium]|nr:hypothetical protein [Pirellulales bacterium]
MADVPFSTFVAGLSADTIGGAEKIPVIDTTPFHVTPDLLVTYVNTQQIAAGVLTPATGDELHGDRSGTQAVFTLDSISDYAIDALEALTVGGTIVAGDWLIYSDAGTLKKVLVSDVTTLVNTAVLDFSTLTADTPAASDLFAFNDGAAKKITLANLETQFWADYTTYVDGLAAVVTTAGTDKFWVNQGGTAKYVTPVELATYFAVPAGDVIGPVTTTENYVPQWDATAKTLKDGLTLQTTVRATGAALDTALATEQAVREAIGLVTDLDIDGATDIGAALVDADLIIVDDGAGGTNRKSAMSRVWTYIETAIQGLTAKTTPVDADIFMIQDSAASNALKELTYENLKADLGTFALDTAAGTGITVAAASYAAGVEKHGTLFKTTIAIDLAGLRSTAAGDIIGDDGTSTDAHIGNVTTAKNGTIFAGKIECLELPAGGDPDIDLYSAVESTGSEDDAITGLTETQLIDSGDHAANLTKSLTAFPANGEFLYLVAGATTDADYTAGLLIITLYGK